MLIYLATFVIFLLFILGMSLGYLLKRGPLKSEDEATAAIMAGATCSMCTLPCGRAGSNKKPKSSCKAELKELGIPHKDV